MLRTILTAAIAASAFAVAAEAQNFGLNPNYGSVSLSGGFSPDPYVVNLQAGGSVSASNVGCSGYISNAPDFRLYFSPGSLPLIVSANSGSDTTLVINTPNGGWVCNDDGGNGLNPSIRFNNPQGGQYDIWVGTYSSGSLAGAQLHISEVSSQ